MSRVAGARWRLIIEAEPADGVWNMAVDRAIQLARGVGGPPTVRLYRWSRPTITLGRFQDAAGVDLEACEAFGVDVVRRITGGRGVLHDDEVTYSVVASVEDGVPRTTAESYRYLSQGLVEAYRALGVDAAVTSRETAQSAGSSACYLHATRADLTCGQSKLSGSAQVWSGPVVLQHGSVTLSRDIAREAAVFGLSPSERLALETKAVTLEDLLPERPGIERVCDALRTGFERGLGVRLADGSLSADELACAEELCRDHTGRCADRGSERFYMRVF